MVNCVLELPWRGSSPGSRQRVKQPWDETRELPEMGVLKLKYVDSLPRQRAAVHYVLDLSDHMQREVAMSLWQRAMAEPDENWSNERLNREHFKVKPRSPLELGDLDEVSPVWEMPTRGVLELDYISFEMNFEAAYRLDLAASEERAIFIKLCERAAAEKADNIVRPKLDGRPINLRELEAGRWLMPSMGIFTCDFVCSEPLHVSTRHYCLDLADQEDRMLAYALKECAEAEPGENWMNETLNGRKIELNELERWQELRRERAAYSRSTTLPSDGILEFDYVVLKPKQPLPATKSMARIGLPRTVDKVVAHKLHQLRVLLVGSNQEQPAEMVKLQHHVLLSYGVDHIAEEDFRRLHISLSRATSDIERLHKLNAATRDSLRFPPYQAVEVVKLMEHPKQASACLRQLYPRLADPG
ncbi:MAG: hypothetical protein SGPRY_007963, partial [Prymnesium sp.]